MLWFPYNSSCARLRNGSAHGTVTCLRKTSPTNTCGISCSAGRCWIPALATLLGAASVQCHPRHRLLSAFQLSTNICTVIRSQQPLGLFDTCARQRCCDLRLHSCGCFGRQSGSYKSAAQHQHTGCCRHIRIVGSFVFSCLAVYLCSIVRVDSRLVFNSLDGNDQRHPTTEYDGRLKRRLRLPSSWSRSWSYRVWPTE